MKANFQEDFRKAIEVARWAPSSHNSQPWFCESFTKGNGKTNSGDTSWLRFGLDSTRILTSLDYHKVEMLVSLGCFSQLMIRLMGALGWQVIHTDFQAPSKRLDATVFEVKFASVEHRLDEFEALKKNVLARRTNRGRFQTTAAIDINALQRELPKQAGLYELDQFDTKLIEDASTIIGIKRLVRDYGDLDFIHYRAWKETYRHIGFSRSKPKIGFSSDALFGKTSWALKLLQSIVFSPVIMQVSKIFSFPKMIAGQLADLIHEEKSLLSISHKDTHANDYQQFQAGAYLIDLWLALTKLGLSCHPLSILLQHDWLNNQVKETVNATGNVVFLARVGQAIDCFPNTDRLEAKELLRGNVSAQGAN